MIDYNIKIPHFGNNEKYTTPEEREREFLEERLRELSGDSLDLVRVES